MMHNSFWPDFAEDNGSTASRVVAFIGNFKFPTGGASSATYVIECEGHHYAARHTAVADALVDAAVKRRVRKSGTPRLL